MTLDAVLFDMDGTLVDTDEHWHAAEVDTFDHYGVRWTEQDHAQILGVPVGPATDYMVERLGGGVSHDEVAARMMGNLVSRLHAHEIRWRAGAQELLAALRAAGVRTALVTASRMPLVEGVFHDVHSLGFDAVVTGDDVTVTKPDPAPYLLAMERLGVGAARAVAVEDSPTGVRSARSAGLVVVAIPHLAPLAAQQGVVPIGGLADVSVGFLRELLLDAQRRRGH